MPQPHARTLTAACPIPGDTTDTAESRVGYRTRGTAPVQDDARSKPAPMRRPSVLRRELSLGNGPAQSAWGPARPLIALLCMCAAAGCDQETREPDAQGDKALLQTLEAQRPDVFFKSVDGDGRVDYLAAQAIASECTASTNPPKTAVDLSDCIAGALADELWNISEPSDLLPRTLLRNTLSRDEYREILTAQRYAGHPVQGSELALTIDANGNVVEVSGVALSKLSMPDVQRLSAFTNEADAIRWAEKRLGHPVILDDRSIDPDAEALMLRVASRDQEHIQHVINERTKRLVQTFDMTLDSHPLVDQKVIHRAFDNGIELVTGSRQSSVKVTREPRGDGCRFSLDHGSDHDHGEPKLGILVDGKFRPDGAKTFRLDGDCDRDAIFRFAPGGEGIADDAVSVYFWLQDLAKFARHPKAAYDAHYPWRSYDPENLRVVVAPSDLCSPGAVACAHSGTTEYKILLPVDTGSTQRLATLAHEYGHIIHFMYDRSPTSFRGQAVDEGFADHNALRYTLFRREENVNRPFDVMDDLSYDSGTHPEYSRAVMGIFEPRESMTGINGRLVYNAQSDLCSPDVSGQPHRCGDVLPTIYWELAWNECRTGHHSEAGTLCAEAQTIVEDHPDAARLANIAFTSAIRKMRDHHTMIRFFEFVSWRYSRFLLDGQIGAQDYQRVLATLNHHCLGWGHQCDTARILPGHQLPIRKALRTRLGPTCAADDCDMLILATEAERTPSATVIAHTTPGTTIPIEERYVRFDEAGDALSFEVDVPVSGLYEFQLLSRQSGSCCDSLSFAVDGGLALPWSVSNDSPSRWRWTDSANARFRTLDAGRHVVTLSYREDLDVEALLVRYRADDDGDGVTNNSDNCVSVPNVQQFNRDGDTRGDACDKCPDLHSPAPHTDLDNDGIGDECDRDKNGDGVPDSLAVIDELENLGAWP